MTDSFYEGTFAEPLTLDIKPARVRDAASPAPPGRAASADRGAAGQCRYMNQKLNSRLSAALREGPLKVEWKAQLDDRVRPDLVLIAGESIVVQGVDRWQRVSAEGRPGAIGPITFGDLFLDPDNACMYVQERNGSVGVRRLSDGEPQFMVSVHLGDAFARRFIARSGSRMIVVGVERVRQGPKLHVPSESTIELIDLGESPRADEYFQLSTLRRERTLLRRSALMLSALHGDELVLATNNFVYFLDWSLRVRAAVNGEFTPVSMSLDEAGRVHLIVQTSEGHALWVLTRDGERHMNFARLPTVARGGYTPPIIGYNHRVYVVGDRAIVAVRPDGETAWVRDVAARPAGAAVTADDQLLVAEGSSIVAYNDKGEARVVHRFAGEDVRTAPVLTAQGRLLAATKTHLYCLEPDTERRR